MVGKRCWLSTTFIRNRGTHPLVERNPNIWVAGIYGPGRTIYTPFLKKCATIYGLNTVFPLKMTFLTLNTRIIIIFSHHDLSKISVRDVKKRVRQNSVQIYTAPTFPQFHVHFTTLNHQTRIVSKNKRPTDLGYKEYGLPMRQFAGIYGLTKGAKNRQIFTLTREKWWLEMIRPWVPKTRNDTAYWRFRPYFFRSPRP